MKKRNLLIGSTAIASGAIAGCAIRSYAGKRKTKEKTDDYKTSIYVDCLGEEHVVTPETQRELFEKFKGYLGDDGLQLSENYTLAKDFDNRRRCNILVTCEDNQRDLLINKNIENGNFNFVVIDEDGTKLKANGKLLEEKGYTVKALNISNNDICKDYKKEYYNPLAYLKNINLKKNELADAYMRKSTIDFVTYCHTNTKSALDEDHFVVAYSCALMIACTTYMLTKDKSWCVRDLINLIEKGIVRKEQKQSQLDLLMNDDALKKEALYNLIGENYDKFRSIDNNRKNEVIAFCVSKLRPFTIPYFEELSKYDTVELQDTSTDKTALFVVTDRNEYSKLMCGLLIDQLQLSRCYTVSDIIYTSNQYSYYIEHARPLVCMIPDLHLVCRFKIDNLDIVNSSRMSYIIATTGSEEIDNIYDANNNTNKYSYYFRLFSSILITHGKPYVCNEKPPKAYVDKTGSEENVKTNIRHVDCGIQMDALGKGMVITDSHI